MRHPSRTLAPGSTTWPSGGTALFSSTITPRRYGSSYNGSARIGQDFEVIALLQPLEMRIPLSFMQTGPAFTLEFIKMRDHPPGWSSEPISMVLCEDAWRTFEREDLGFRSYGMRFTDAELKQQWFNPDFARAKHLAGYLGVTEEALRKRARRLGLPRRGASGSPKAPQVPRDRGSPMVPRVLQRLRRHSNPNPNPSLSL